MAIVFSGKVVEASNMKRWHFENCKNKEVLNDRM